MFKGQRPFHVSLFVCLIDLLDDFQLTEDPELTPAILLEGRHQLRPFSLQVVAGNDHIFVFVHCLEKSSGRLCQFFIASQTTCYEPCCDCPTIHAFEIGFLDRTVGDFDEDVWIPHRLRIRGELAILKSTGVIADLTATLQVLLGTATPDFLVNEYYPKTVYVRARNIDTTGTDMAQVLALLRRALPAGSDLHLIYSTSEADDANLFRFSSTSGTPELSSTKGFGNGTLTGVQN